MLTEKSSNPDVFDLLDEKVRTFIDDSKDGEELEKVPDHLTWMNSKVCIKVYDAPEIYEYEVKVYRLLGEHGICPPVLGTFELRPKEFTEEDCGQYVVVTPYCGKNIRQLFYSSQDNKDYPLDGTPLAESVPPIIRKEVYKLCSQMKTLGMYMADFRPDNFTLDSDDRVWVVDCGCVYRRSY